MKRQIGIIGAIVAAILLLGSFLAMRAGAQGQPASPRPGLTAQQTKQAVELAKGAMKELRKKTEGAVDRDADQREYVVNVELLDRKEKESSPEAEKANAKGEAKAKVAGPRAIVTSYRYFDDITVFSTVDLVSGRVVDVQAAQHMPTPLSDDEFEEAVAVARDKSEEIKKLYEQFGDQLKVYPQFSQFTVKDDPRFHRVVHLNYRIGKHDLSYPRPQVDLTSRVVVTPPPEAEPKAPVRRRDRNPQ
jgi:hypothetical protein